MDTKFNEHFGEIIDPRVERTKKHELIDIIAVALCAALSRS